MTLVLDFGYFSLTITSRFASFTSGDTILAVADVFIEMSGLTCLFVNIRGLRQGAGELCATSLRFQPDFIVLVETHLDSDSITPFLLLGYVVVDRKDRSSHGDGVLIMCKSYLLVDVIDCTEYYVSGACEIIAVTLQGTAILCVYRQPGDTDLTVTDSLNCFISDHNLPIILLGDFNVHHQEWLASSRISAASRSLREFCELNGLAQLVNTPTRSSSILDLIITPYCGTVCYHPPLGTSDHVSLLTFFSLSLGVIAPPPS